MAPHPDPPPCPLWPRPRLAPALPRAQSLVPYAIFDPTGNVLKTVQSIGTAANSVDSIVANFAASGQNLRENLVDLLKDKEVQYSSTTKTIDKDRYVVRGRLTWGECRGAGGRGGHAVGGGLSAGPCGTGGDCLMLIPSHLESVPRGPCTSVQVLSPKRLPNQPLCALLLAVICTSCRTLPHHITLQPSMRLSRRTHGANPQPPCAPALPATTRRCCCPQALVVIFCAGIIIGLLLTGFVLINCQFGITFALICSLVVIIVWFIITAAVALSTQGVSEVCYHFERVAITMVPSDLSTLTE